MKSDYIIKNSMVYDGSGNIPYLADVSIGNGKILQIADKIEDKSAFIINGEGLCLAPGFIDSHTHDDAALISDKNMLCKLTQGITSVVTGNCGISMAPLTKSPVGYRPFDLLSKNDNSYFASFSEYIKHLENNKPSINYYPLVGNGALRVSACDNPELLPSAKEIAFMCELLEINLHQGARGLSVGIEYPLGINVTTEEISALIKCVEKHKGVVSMHIRTEGDGIIEALEEAFNLAQYSNEIPLIISHHKCAGVNNFNNSIKTLPMIDKKAKERNLGMDAYPYTYASTVLMTGFAKLAEKVIITSSETMPEYEGLELSNICSKLNCDIETAIKRLSPAKALYYVMHEDDVKRILSHPCCMLGSDGLHDQKPHPRLWGSFPRYLGKYVRDENISTLQEAIRKITSLPAHMYGMEKRGAITQGYAADLVLFDKNTIIDTATFDNPSQALGISHVFVNGKLALDNGEFCSQYSGIKL